jgi:mRNA interferase HicA
MKRTTLVKHLERHGCVLVREGGRHSVYRHPATGRTTTVPRHVEIGNLLARKICRDLGIPDP